MIVVRLKWNVIIACCAFFTISCAVHDVREETALPASATIQFSESGNAEVPDRWWEAFGSNDLNALMEETLSGNLDLKTAWTRLDQYAAIAVQSGAGKFVQVSYDADVARSGSEANSRSSSVGSYGLGLLMSYEVDLWKRIESQERAAQLDLMSSRQDLEATALSLSGLVAEHWFYIITQQAQLDLLKRQLESGSMFLELNELRFSQGKASAVSVFQQREQVSSIRSQFPQTESNLAVFQNQLAVLAGKPPQSEPYHVQSTFPELPPVPSTGIPAKVLLRRPDIRAAQLRIAAADYRIAAAIADRFPALRLSAGTGLQANQIGDVFSNWLWNLAGNLAGPIVDGKRRAAEVERTQAVLQERILSYEKAVLQALQEIENALIQERKQKEYVTALEKQYEFAQTTLEETNAQFGAGISEYLPVLTALTEVQRLERTMLAAQRDLFLYRIDLYKALGGSWMSSLEHPNRIDLTSQLETTDENR